MPATAEIAKLPEITDIGTMKYGELVNGAMPRAEFNKHYFAGLFAQFKVECALKRTFEKADSYAWKDVVSKVLNEQERGDLQFYRKIHDDYNKNKLIGEVNGNLVDFSKYMSAINAIKKDFAIVDIYTSATLENGKIKGGDKLEAVAFPATGYAFADSGTMLYDNIGLAGFSPRTCENKSEAITKNVPFFEHMITGVDKNATKIINPKEVSERETSLQYCADMGSGILVPDRGFFSVVRGPLSSDFGGPGGQFGAVGRRLVSKK